MAFPHDDHPVKCQILQPGPMTAPSSTNEELKHDAVASVVLNTLYKNTPLQTSFAVNNIALVNGRPMMLNLLDLVRHFVEHRHDVIVRRTRFDLATPPIIIIFI